MKVPRKYIKRSRQPADALLLLHVSAGVSATSCHTGDVLRLPAAGLGWMNGRLPFSFFSLDDWRHRRAAEASGRNKRAITKCFATSHPHIVRLCERQECERAFKTVTLFWQTVVFSLFSLPGLPKCAMPVTPRHFCNVSYRGEGLHNLHSCLQTSHKENG